MSWLEARSVGAGPLLDVGMRAHERHRLAMTQ
jgi:hypothetical protein